MTKEGDNGIFSRPTAGNKMQYWTHLDSLAATELQKDPSMIVSNVQDSIYTKKNLKNYPSEKLFWIFSLFLP